jgi:hypothetical protein
LRGGDKGQRFRAGPRPNAFRWHTYLHPRLTISDLTILEKHRETDSAKSAAVEQHPRFLYQPAL